MKKRKQERRMLQKILTGVLTLAMVFTMMNLPIFAHTVKAEDQVKIEITYLYVNTAGDNSLYVDTQYVLAGTTWGDFFDNYQICYSDGTITDANADNEWKRSIESQTHYSDDSKYDTVEITNYNKYSDCAYVTFYGYPSTYKQANFSFSYYEDDVCVDSGAGWEFFIPAGYSFGSDEAIAFVERNVGIYSYIAELCNTPGAAVTVEGLRDSAGVEGWQDGYLVNIIVSNDSGNTDDNNNDGSGAGDNSGNEDGSNTGDDDKAPVQNGWCEQDGVKYWYEDGVKQGTEGRGKEIYDGATDAWYWLDAIDDGKVAADKDVYQESEAGNWGDKIGEDGKRYGKWVRYDESGRMVKGWQTTEKGTYYFDETYGTMAKGYATIDHAEYYFNPETGVLEYEIGEVPENGWKTIDGRDCWYENYVRQGYSVDASYRGKEIYDEETDAWYWLDNIQGGAKAISKDVYQESSAGEWGDYVDADGVRCGKWVRYDENGHMIKGWQETEAGTYYFDLIYGTMAKGAANIDGAEYYFDTATGIQQ